MRFFRHFDDFMVYVIIIGEKKQEFCIFLLLVMITEHS